MEVNRDSLSKVLCAMSSRFPILKEYILDGFIEFIEKQQCMELFIRPDGTPTAQCRDDLLVYATGFIRGSSSVMKRKGPTLDDILNTRG